ncbi:MAG: serine/threonine protein kinase [Alphaproteobacteria bacterium]|nr:serine/threonine protein kinase [Alphaproteobacteria bacterium]
MPAGRPDPYIGKLFAERFLVLDKLGEGSMGTVYEARELAVSRPVALKMIHRHLAVHKRLVDRFRREMAITARMDSPHSVKVYDFGKAEGGELYLVMELLDGKPLSDIIAQSGPLSPERAVHIGVQVCEALATAHALNIIHRDLKPENIMLLNQRGETAGPDSIKILDFGVARIIDTSDEDDEAMKTMTKAGSPLGTLPYMSPQQVACEHLDHTTDLYSLGIVLYEMLTGAPPFACKTRKQALNDHLFKEAPRLSTVRPGLPKGLEMTVHNLLEKEPPDRPQSAADVRAMLKSSAPPPGHGSMGNVSGDTMVPDDQTDPPPEPVRRLPPNLAAVPQSAFAAAQPPGGETMVPDADDEETVLLPPVTHLDAPGGGKVNLAALAAAAQAADPAPAEPEPVTLIAPDAQEGPPWLALLAFGGVVMVLSMIAGAGLMWWFIR